MQMSAMKVYFQIAECSPLYQKKKDGLILEKNLSSQEFTFIFSNVKKVLVGFQKTSLNAKEVFRKPFSRPIS